MSRFPKPIKRKISIYHKAIGECKTGHDKDVLLSVFANNLEQQEQRIETLRAHFKLDSLLIKEMTSHKTADRLIREAHKHFETYDCSRDSARKARAAIRKILGVSA